MLDNNNNKNKCLLIWFSFKFFSTPFPSFFTLFTIHTLLPVGKDKVKQNWFHWPYNLNPLTLCPLTGFVTYIRIGNLYYFLLGKGPWANYAFWNHGFEFRLCDLWIIWSKFSYLLNSFFSSLKRVNDFYFAELHQE